MHRTCCTHKTTQELHGSLEFAPEGQGGRALQDSQGAVCGVRETEFNGLPPANVHEDVEVRTEPKTD